MLELACDESVFHFNKHHLQDPTIPMWVIKCKGETYYLNHVDCQVPWSTKETPDNNATKGSIKIKHCLVTINDENEATITNLTEADKTRLKNIERGISRVLITGHQLDKFKQAVQNNNIKHAPVKALMGGCGTSFYITEIMKKSHLTMLTLSLGNEVFRVLKENEMYYKMYDDPTYKDKDYIDEDELWNLYDDDDEESEEVTNVYAPKVTTVMPKRTTILGKLLPAKIREWSGLDD